MIKQIKIESISKVQQKRVPNAMGRKWFNGQDIDMVVAKLDVAFSIGCTVLEACIYADITPDSFYRYVKTDDELRNRFERLREKPILKARQTVVKDLHDPNTAKWYLEKKRPKEFSSAGQMNVGTLNVTQQNLVVNKKVMILKEKYEKELFDQITQKGQTQKVPSDDG